MTASEINVDRYLLHILLLLSADVEHNPGPNIRKLNNIGMDTTPLGAEFLRDSTNGLKTAHVNTGNGGLIYHIDEIKRVISKYNLDILCVSETWVDNTHNPNEFGIDGYHFEHRDNNKTFQGKQGVGLFIKNNISYKPMPDMDPSDLMCMTIQIIPSNRKPWLITAIYRHPKSPVSYLDKLEVLIMNIDNSNLDSVICGDFNIDYQKINQDGSPASTLNSIISAYNFTQTINQLTRVTEKSSTTIDLTLTNCVNKITSGVAIVSVADHLMNFAIYGDKKTIHHHKYVTSRNYKKMNENKLLQDLQRVPWSTIEIIDDIDEAWSIWKSLFRQVIDQHAPIRKFRAKQSQCKWHTEEIEELKLVRDEYHSRAINNQDPHDWAVYRKLRNRCTNMSRNIKKQYFQDEIKKSKNSSKTMWTCLKQLLPQSSKASVTTLDIGGKLISTAQGVADEVNSFFTNIGKQLANKIPSQDTSHKHYLNRQEPITSTFLFSPITSADVHKHLSELDITKATGPDDIPSRLLKLSAPVISDSLAFLFNFSLISGKFPAEWKIAKVSAIFKKGSKLDIGNYRPISVLPILSKVLEKLVHLQVYKYLQDNNILKREQSGFRSKHSTQTSLHYILEDIYKRTNNCEMVGLVALDLRKAFDTVDHQILMDKLSHYGIYEQWFKSYISDRKQFTSVDGKFSSSLDIKTGVPQG